MARRNTDDHDTEPTPRRPRGAPTEDPDLTWLFCQSAAEISGIGSSHGILVNLAQTGAVMAGAGTRGIPRCVDGISPRRAAAVDKERPLRARFAQLAPTHQRVLEAAYGERAQWVTELAADAKHRLPRRFLALLPVTAAAARGWAAEGARKDKEAEKGSAAKRAQLAVEAEEWRAKGLLFWLTGPAIDADALKAARDEAEAMVNAAWQAWGETREKAPRQPRQPAWSSDEDGAISRAVRRARQEDGDRPSGEYPKYQGGVMRRAAS